MNRRRATGVLASIGLLLLAARGHANGLVALEEALEIAALGAVVLAPVVITMEAVAYRRLLGISWGRAWLSALVANLVAVVPLAPALFCLSLVVWSAPNLGEEGLALLVVGLVGLLGAVGGKTGVVQLLLRQTPTQRPAWLTAVWLTAATTALVLLACYVEYWRSGI